MMREKLEKFLSSEQRTLWLEVEEDGACLRVYVRKANHVCGQVSCKTLDFANAEAIPEKRGMFTKFIAVAEQIALRTRSGGFCRKRP
jgi:hypothetical protein